MALCPEDDRNVFRIQQRLQRDLEVAQMTEFMREGSDTATKALQVYLHWRYRSILSVISELPEPEADSVEPLFSQFESILLELELGKPIRTKFRII
jgi:hypothetical protein